MLRVSEVAELAGVSVRTLHHYDEIDLLKPDTVNDAGYRLYSQQTLTVLQEILFYKELDFSLKEIKALIEKSSDNRLTVLEKQKILLEKKQQRLSKIIETIDSSIAAETKGISLENTDLFKGFDMKEINDHIEKYKEETKEKWGNSAQYKESQKRTAKYTEADWKAITERGDLILKDLNEKRLQGIPASDVGDLVEAWKNHITDSFYTCTDEILVGLADMYIADQRFTESMDKHGKGLTQFLHDAIYAYAVK